MKSLCLYILLLISQIVYATENLLVTPEWLTKQLDRTDLVLIDVRPEERYLDLHIKNAIHLDVNDTFCTGTNQNLLAPMDNIKSLLQRKGIRPDRQIIIYGDGRLLNASHLFWVLDVFSFNKLSLLDGGLNEWKKRGFPTSHQAHQLPASKYQTTINPDALATTFSVQLSLHDPIHKLIDARTKEQYLGLESKIDQFGHLPDAKNIPQILKISDKNGRLLSEQSLKELYSDLNSDHSVTVDCNRGKESALSYFVLRKLGYKVKAYDGSWFEWSKNPLLTKAKVTNLETKPQ